MNELHAIIECVLDDAASTNSPGDLDGFVRALRAYSVAANARAEAIRLRNEGRVDAALQRESMSEEYLTLAKEMISSIE